MTAVDHAELKPCPFCGGTAHMQFSKFELHSGFHAVCHGKKDCPLYCSDPYRAHDTREEAATVWNLRTQAPDSWRPSNAEVANVLRSCDAMERAIERRGLPKSEADVCVSTEWLRKACAALRPQTAESGE